MRRDYDTTGWCDRSEHDRCDGVLHAGTGYHWWCACLCHQDMPIVRDGQPDTQRAFDVWKNARAALTTREKP